MLKIKKKINMLTHFSLEDQFEQERKKILNHAVTLGSAMCAIIVPVFGLLDLVAKPHMIKPFMLLRLIVTLMCIGIYYLSKSKIGEKYTYPLSAVVGLSVCGSIAYMCFLDMGPTDPYYAGINLPLLGFGIMLPLTMTEGIILFGLVWMSYLIPNWLILEPYETSTFISNNFFLLSTIIISLVGCQFNLIHQRNQWNVHRKLRAAHKKIKNHANELEQKVQERTQCLLQSERLAVVGQLAGGIAHDFNNHLTAILGISELMKDTFDETDKRRNDVESIYRVGRRAADLVRQLLAFSRRQILMPKILNLNDVLDEVEKMLKRLIGEHIELIVSKAPDLGFVRADPVQIEQIILNLAVNARDAMCDGGRLIIETDNISLDKAYCKHVRVSVPPGDYVMLAITDTGMGMSEDVRLKIFEPFFTTKEQGKGTGLGLSTVYGIVKQSNGDIFVYSEEGKGTTFKVYLPRVKDESPKAEDTHVKTEDLPKGKETILLVEDEEVVRKLTARMLEKQGYTVIQAEEGQKALELTRDHTGRIDLLVTDVVMPNMGGRALAEHLQSQSDDLKVLYISGYTDKTVHLQNIVDSNAEFLQKPYTLETLSYKIRNIFDN